MPSSADSAGRCPQSAWPLFGQRVNAFSFQRTRWICLGEIDQHGQMCACACLRAQASYMPTKSHQICDLGSAQMACIRCGAIPRNTMAAKVVCDDSLTLERGAAGVGIASMAEPEFSMLAFGCAMLSNVLFAALVMKEVFICVRCTRGHASGTIRYPQMTLPICRNLHRPKCRGRISSLSTPCSPSS